MSTHIGHFTLPEMVDNAEGWGPTSGSAELAEIPFAPFSKGDRLGRVSDFVSSKFYRNSRNRAYGAGTTGMFAFNHEVDDSSFALVHDSLRVQKRTRGRGGFVRFQGRARGTFQRGSRQERNAAQQAMRGGRGGSNSARGRGGSARGGRGRGWARGGRPWGRSAEREPAEPSITINPEWREVLQLDITKFSQISMPVPEAAVLKECGALRQYNAKLDGINPRMPVALREADDDVVAINASTSDDPILKQAVEGKLDGVRANVFATQNLLAVLMCAASSVYSWDILVHKKNGKIILDRRPESKLCLQTVNENGSLFNVEQDSESADHPDNLMQEATFINNAINEQVLLRGSDDNKTMIQLEAENPFAAQLAKDGKEPANVGFVYRQWKLSKHVTIVARCEVNAWIAKSGQRKERILIRALNEFDSQSAGDGAWRKRLNTQPGAVLASEMKNNRNKLARWTAEACLAGVTEMRLAYVSRVSSQDQTFHHDILAVSRTKKNVLSPVAKEANLWATLLTIVHQLTTLEDGEYLILRDPNEKILRIYDTATQQQQKE